MALALELGRRGLGRTWPNPAVGAVAVALGGQLVGRGWTQAGGRPHAETEALRRAGAAARGATLYVSLEPCCHHGKTPPCTDAIIAAGIVRVVAPLEDPNPKVAGHGFARLRAGGIAVDVGVGAAEARRAHAGHLCRMRDGRPHVTLKLAVSADAKAGLAGRRPAAITGEIARERVQLMRAMNDAVLTGIGSVHADDPNLNCRLNGMIGRSPVRVVLDSGLTLPLGSRLAATARQIPVWVMAAAGAREAAEEALRGRGVEVFRTKPGEGGLDLTAVVRLLAERGITRLMVEAGPRVAASFVKADLVDAAVLFRGPDTIGADGIDALEGLKLEALTQSPRLKSLGVEGLGRDTVEIFERAIFERA
jgi:diaminohydroxyphosphoribosylaminopyrimidine deaminase/5-amino-6-(5-phosphoribosylamino)uracil reductase